MLALVLVLLSQVTPDSRVSRVERVPGGRMEGGRGGVKGWAFFEAFPVGGAGTTTACSTTPPTGAKGETLTFARTGNATCTATATGGLATTGIANGDLVVLSANQPRVEYDSAGTLGLLVESARTNSALRSESFDNAAWTKGSGAGSAVPTVTADYATAPDGTLSADRVQFDACATAGQYSAVYSTALKAAGVGAGSVFCRGTSASQTISVCAYGGTTVNTVCTQITCPADSWSRPIAIGTAANTGLVLGCDNEGFTGGGNTGTADVLLWGAQLEAGSYATSYIPTTSAAVTRSVESAAFNGLSISSANGLSWAATVWHLSGNGGAVWAASVALVQDASNRTQLYRANTNVHQCDVFSTSGTRSVGPVISAYVAGQAYRQACSYSGAGASSTVSGYRDGTLTGTSAAGLTSAWTATSVLPGALGPAATNAPCDCITSRICIDPDTTRCR